MQRGTQEGVGPRLPTLSQERGGPRKFLYNHVLAIFLTSRFLFPVHAIACFLFIVIGGAVATLNHTRLDISALYVPFTSIPVFAVRVHDTHHAIPNTNYRQYIMLWDWVMGTFKPHPKYPGLKAQ